MTDIERAIDDLRKEILELRNQLSELRSRLDPFYSQNGLAVCHVSPIYQIPSWTYTPTPDESLDKKAGKQDDSSEDDDDYQLTPTNLIW